MRMNFRVRIVTGGGLLPPIVTAGGDKRRKWRRRASGGLTQPEFGDDFLFVVTPWWLLVYLLVSVFGRGACPFAADKQLTRGYTAAVCLGPYVVTWIFN